MAAPDDDIGSVRHWRGLDALAGLARRLPAGTADDRALERWLVRQLGRTTDRAFARLFADHLDLPGIEERDYLHRVVETDGLRLLGGIRFYGQDVARPFVELIAWTPLGGADGRAPEGTTRHAPPFERLCAIVAHEWRAFAPGHLRVHLPQIPAYLSAEAPPTLPSGTTTDVSVHLADVREMNADTGTVGLERFDDLAEAVALVRTRFAALRREDPALARDVTPSGADTLAECDAAGSLFAIRVDDETVGLIATLAGAIDWIEGEVVVEEVIRTDRAGRGYASAAQRALASRLAREGRARRLSGTIDSANAASRRSAERAGRPAVSRYAFVPLPPPPR